MKRSHSLVLTAPVIAGLAGPAAAAGIDLTVTIPQLKVAEYHKPYVAIWLEQPGQAAVRNLALWYDADNREDKGTKWLHDLRQWWRKSGRTLKFPLDGITGPTRAPGAQAISFSTARGPLAGLAPGKYELVVEAAREVGGREVVRLPFSWPVKSPQVVKAAGTGELGTVTATIKP
ncbi:DUF2271 domain-containing protein [Sphingomonas solaris]|uniref:DUF2271 domain-containing protein n=1 Tax=Alterirhizorhabdus solaris TaxID=2529389 RepID=A0A558QT83_9SPHN|nr:DUF2271 domain-containing protein [Sphingomonas solaris]TVV70292.1 DUF2271 domain-containing protein [Sphingomonas solaris]